MVCPPYVGGHVQTILMLWSGSIRLINFCVFSETCAQQEVWKSVEDAVEAVLRNITLSVLAQRQRKLAAQMA